MEYVTFEGCALTFIFMRGVEDCWSWSPLHYI